MEEARFDQVAKAAFFVVDISAFQATLATYNPLIASQTIVFGWDATQSGEAVSPSIEEAEPHQETEAA